MIHEVLTELNGTIEAGPHDQQETGEVAFPLFNVPSVIKSLLYLFPQDLVELSPPMLLEMPLPSDIPPYRTTLYMEYQHSF